MTNILTFYKTKFNKNIINSLIGINIFVFFIQILIPNINVYFMMPTVVESFIKQPWSIISSFFMHGTFFHITFNMLWLYQLGDTLLNNIGKKKFINLYMVGGIITGLSVLLYGYLFDINSYLLGASGAVSVIIFASIYLFPEEIINIFGIFELKMKQIAWGLVVFSVFGLFGTNTGGNIAHLSGALMGYIYIKLYLKKNFLDDIFKF